ncbi:MAG: hypothetical protein ACXVD9_10695, partial [Actinomycetota bacterium]
RQLSSDVGDAPSRRSPRSSRFPPCPVRASAAMLWRHDDLVSLEFSFFNVRLDTLSNPAVLRKIKGAGGVM